MNKSIKEMVEEIQGMSKRLMELEVGLGRGSKYRLIRHWMSVAGLSLEGAVKQLEYEAKIDRASCDTVTMIQKTAAAQQSGQGTRPT